ncbi:MAG: hypothetical protein F8N37_19475 [Telmatospirillum sp.]|nr:hypothetical protein [Telmatospirillum sp.]
MSQLQSSPFPIETAALAAIKSANPAPANPGVVGLAAFGMTTLLAQAHSFGLVGVGPVIYLAIFFGGTAQLVAGIQEHRNGNNFGYCAFSAFGCFWLSFAGIAIGNRYEIFKTAPADVGVFLIGWTLFCALLWVASRGVSRAMCLCFTTLVLGLACLSAAHLGLPAFEIPGALLMAVTALIAWYMLLHILVKDLYGRDLLPVGAPLVVKP